jgi:hypothetical protein
MGRFHSRWKCAVIAAFFLVEFGFSVLGRGRDLDMRIVGSRWNAPRSTARQLLYDALYTLSFCSISGSRPTCS